jgi:phage terminase large subunit
VTEVSAAAWASAPEVEFPEKLLPLMDRENRKRYYIAYGGRGGARSWSFARALLLQCLEDPLFVLCAREIQKSLDESVKLLLENQIKLLGLEGFFDVLDSEIRGKNGCRIVFAGLKNMSAKNLKSYEGVDIVWVEEAEGVSKASWNNLIPTIRADGSEIWVSFNPDMETDETYQRFVVNPPDDAFVERMIWEDNPWFPEVLQNDRRKMQRDDPEEYENIWNGRPRLVAKGAIYTKEVIQMIEERRFRPVPYDPRLRVHTIWDLGWNDQTSIIFAQRLHSEVRIIDYEEESFVRPDQWAKRINAKPYVYGSHWLPHDGEHETQQGAGVSLQNQLKPLLGMKPEIVKRPSTVELPIRAARMMWPRAYMDDTKCARLLECLKRFRRAIPTTTNEPGSPVKDEFRHGADAWGYLAMIVDKLTNDGKEPRRFKLEDTRPMDAGMGR